MVLQTRPSDAFEIYDRYYGFVTGFSVHFLQFDFASSRYANQRSRIMEFLNEIEVEWNLPIDHGQYLSTPNNIEQLIQLLQLKSKSLADFFVFGYQSLDLLVDWNSTNAAQLLESIRTICEEYRLPTHSIVEHMQENWAQGLTDDSLISELLARSYDLTAFTLVDVPRTPEACFVIMPFGSTFIETYKSLFSKAIARAGLVPLRAWESISNENYLHMLRMILGKCGTTLADISSSTGNSSSPNLNVVHEVGISMGVGNLNLLITRDTNPTLPSNFTGLPYMTYDPDSEGFPASSIDALAEVIRDMSYL